MNEPPAALEPPVKRGRGRPPGYSPTGGKVRRDDVVIPGIIVSGIPQDGRTVSDHVRDMVKEGRLVTFPAREGPIGKGVRIRAFAEEVQPIRDWIKAHHFEALGRACHRVENGRWVDCGGQPLFAHRPCPCCGRAASPTEPADPSAQVAAAVADAAARLGVKAPASPEEVAALFRAMVRL